MRKSIKLFIPLILLPALGFSQHDSIANTFQKDFDSFKKSIQTEHKQFKVKNDSVFSQFLKGSWASFNVLYKAKTEAPKPVAQPTKPPTLEKKSSPDDGLQIDSLKKSNISNPKKIELQIEKKGQPESVESGGTAMINLAFYGNETKLSYPSDIPQIGRISSENITSYFDQASNSPSILRLVSELAALKKKLKLNDWGYYRLAENSAEKMEPNLTSKTLLVWVILLKSGYNVKTGFSDNSVFLMVPFREEIFNSYYVSIEEVIYYIPEAKNTDEISQLTIHKADYPGNRPLSLTFDQLPELGIDNKTRELNFRGTKLIVGQNTRLIDYYNDYPLCEMKVYFSTPLSNELLNSLDNYFTPLFSGMTKKQKVATLLEFIQKAFPYQTDKEQFGREKYFFPDELFFYPFSDCEDRSILFSRLVQHFTHLKCVGLDYPGHVNTAVYFQEETRGDFVTVKGFKYIVCDPTYINAPIGYLPDEFTGKSPKIIIFD